MKYIFVITFFLISTLSLVGQVAKSTDNQTVSSNDFLSSLQADVENEGKIVINQDARIHYLVNKHVKINESKASIKGWRIQIYNSSGKESKERAKKEREKFLSKFPEANAYLIYQPPYFKIRVGDFRTKQEGFELYKKISKIFPVLYFVPDDINFPTIE